MQDRSFFTHQRTAAAALCMVLIMLIQQSSASPVAAQVQPFSDHDAVGLRAQDGVQVLRRIARMTPLWRILNSKPFGAYCQNNYECSTGFCRAGQCSNSQSSAPVKY